MRQTGAAIGPFRLIRRIPGCFLVLGMLGCAAPLNYTNPDGPRYTGCEGDTSVGWNPRTGTSPELQPGERTPRSELRVVSFNIEFSLHIDEAIVLLRSDPDLAYADVVLLQEMDEKGVRRIADALGYCWVYYPAVRHPRYQRPFGNAVLSRYPFLEDHKVPLPHLGQFGKTQRIAVGATLNVNGTPLRVYSVHLATTVELGPERRREQALAIVQDAASAEGPVLIGGDLNEKSIAEIFADAGYLWMTRDLGQTTNLASLDHFLLLNLKPISGQAVGKSADARGASDHVPIWIRLEMPLPGGGSD